jgi:predicted ferric reductase
MFVIVVRSCIHFFASDGGANSIAGIDISVAGGDNIIAIFHQWGAMQLLLVLLLYVLFFKYPGLTPLIALTLVIEPIFRLISGKVMPVTAEGTPPGESLNGASFYVLAVLFIISLIEKAPRKKS